MPLPHDRFPMAVRERRFVLVAVDESLIADLITEGLEGRDFRASVEGLPKGAVISGVFYDPMSGSRSLRGPSRSWTGRPPRRGCDLNPDYVAMALRRAGRPALGPSETEDLPLFDLEDEPC